MRNEEEGVPSKEKEEKVWPVPCVASVHAEEPHRHGQGAVKRCMFGMGGKGSRYRLSARKTYHITYHGKRILKKNICLNM